MSRSIHPRRRVASLALTAGLLAMTMGGFAQTPAKAPATPAPADTEQLAIAHPADYIPIPVEASLVRPQESVKPAVSAADPLAPVEAQLLQLATELKAAVDKSNSGVLSVDVVRAAASIQKLAKGAKQKMKLSQTPN